MKILKEPKEWSGVDIECRRCGAKMHIDEGDVQIAYDVELNSFIGAYCGIDDCRNWIDLDQPYQNKYVYSRLWDIAEVNDKAKKGSA